MSDDEAAVAANRIHRRLAAEMLERRQLRNKHFERQAFGEQRWDMMLVLFADDGPDPSVDRASQLLATPPATTLALARILAGHDLVELGDSPGGWSDIPIRLSALAKDRMDAYFAELVGAGLAI